ncbi:MAG: extracellular solute-binding protein [Aerococcus sp.]|nr:extracellular solute-binding protein [Aerococcus sp.]
MTALALFGCTDNGQQKDAQSQSAASNSEGGNTLVVSAGAVADYVKENIGDFEKANNVKVEIQDADMFEKLDALSLDGPAGTAADVYIAPYDRIGSLGSQGQLAEAKMPEGSEGNYDEKDAKQVTYDGKQYGVPAVIESLVMFYNKDLIDKVPATFQDLEAIGKDKRFEYKDEPGTNVGFLTKWTDFYYAYGLLAGYGGYVFGENGTNPEDIGLNTKGAVEGIEYATGWFKNVWPKGMQDVKASEDFMKKSFSEGKTAVMIGGPWEAAGFKEAGVNYGVAKIPTLPNGKAYQPFAGGKGWVISSYSKNKELAQKFLDWVSSEEQQDKLYNKLGEVPANLKAREKAMKSGDELTKAVIDVYKDAQVMPNIGQMAEVWVGAENMMFDAASGNKSAQQTADDAVKAIKENIKQKGY